MELQTILPFIALLILSSERIKRSIRSIANVRWKRATQVKAKQQKNNDTFITPSQVTATDGSVQCTNRDRKQSEMKTESEWLNWSWKLQSLCTTTSGLYRDDIELNIKMPRIKLTNFPVYLVRSSGFCWCWFLFHLRLAFGNCASRFSPFQSDNLRSYSVER